MSAYIARGYMSSRHVLKIIKQYLALFCPVLLPCAHRDDPFVNMRTVPNYIICTVSCQESGFEKYRARLQMQPRPLLTLYAFRMSGRLRETPTEYSAAGSLH